MSVGLIPLHETFVALIRLFGSKGHAARGLEILAAMEKLNYDIRKAWLVLVGITLFGSYILVYFSILYSFIFGELDFLFRRSWLKATI